MVDEKDPIKDFKTPTVEGIPLACLLSRPATIYQQLSVGECYVVAHAPMAVYKFDLTPLKVMP